MALTSNTDVKMINGFSYPTPDSASGNTYSGVTSPIETIEKDHVKLLPMTTKASSNDDTGSVIEYGKRFLPPLWVDIQEEIERHIDEITTKSKLLLFLGRGITHFQFLA